MKQYLSLIPKAALLVVASSCIGLVLLLGAYCLPTDPMEQNVRESVATFEREGTYPHVNLLGANTQLDNWTDSIMILTAAYSGPQSLADRTINAYRYSTSLPSPTDTLVACYDRGEAADTVSYGRYWHGYLVFLKPLLLVFNYDQLRLLNRALVLVTTAALCGLLWLRKLGRYIPPYLLALLLIDPTSIGRSLQFSAIYYVFSLACIVFLAGRRWFLASEQRTVLFFVAVGCAASYFDLLTYPLVAFGIPAALYLCCAKADLKTAFRVLFFSLVGWGCGYGGMWACKWIWSAILGYPQVITQAFSALGMRSSTSDSSGNSIAYLDVLRQNFFRFRVPALIPTLAYAAFAVVWGTVRRLRARTIQPLKSKWLLYIPGALLPFVWYLGTSNHSFIHSWFTFREGMIFFFALLCLLAGFAFEKAGKNSPPAKKSR